MEAINNNQSSQETINKLKSALQNTEKSDRGKIHEQLGIAYRQIGDKTSALKHLHKALSAYKEMNIIGENTCDVSAFYQDIITPIERELGLHIVSEGDKYGMADKNEIIVIPCVWSEIKKYGFSEGFAAVKGDNQLWGYIDYCNKLVIPCMYRIACPFREGLAHVEENIDDIVPHDCYIDKEGDFIAWEQELSFSAVKKIYEARILASYGMYKEAAERILPTLGTLDPNPRHQLVLYYMAAKEYDKVVEWCKRLTNINFDEYWELVWPKLILADCYENGLGVEKDLLEAFHQYNSVRHSRSPSDEELQELDHFLERHPKLKEHPEVQNALDPFDENEEY